METVVLETKILTVYLGVYGATRPLLADAVRTRLVVGRQQIEFLEVPGKACQIPVSENAVSQDLSQVETNFSLGAYCE